MSILRKGCAEEGGKERGKGESGGGGRVEGGGGMHRMVEWKPTTELP